MATLTIENVPPPLMRRLQEAARQHGRSPSAEALVRLEEAFTANRPQPSHRADTADEKAPAPVSQRGRFLEIDGLVETTSGDPVADARRERAERLARS